VRVLKLKMVRTVERGKGARRSCSQNRGGCHFAREGGGVNEKSVGYGEVARVGGTNQKEELIKASPRGGIDKRGQRRHHSQYRSTEKVGFPETSGNKLFKKNNKPKGEI